jgi:hypothetical protein
MSPLARISSIWAVHLIAIATSALGTTAFDMIRPLALK